MIPTATNLGRSLFFVTIHITMQFSKKTVLKVFFVLLVIAGAFYFAHVAQGSEAVQDAVARYGYWGIFVVAFISGFNLVVPVPAIAFMPLFLESGFSFFMTTFVITVGITLADSLAYLIGNVGHTVIEKNNAYQRETSLYQKLLRLKKKHRYAPIVILAIYSVIAPLPNELMVIPLGLLGYKYRVIFPIVFVGNFIFNVIYASGIESLFEYLL